MTINSSAPRQFKKRILLAVTGMSPHIVTETLYALCIDQEPAFIPTEVHILSTQEGIKCARLTLLDGGTGHFQRLCTGCQLSGMTFDAAPFVQSCTDHQYAPEDGALS